MQKLQQLQEYFNKNCRSKLQQKGVHKETVSEIFNNIAVYNWSKLEIDQKVNLAIKQATSLRKQKLVDHLVKNIYMMQHAGVSRREIERIYSQIVPEIERTEKNYRLIDPVKEKLDQWIEDAIEKAQANIPTLPMSDEDGLPIALNMNYFQEPDLD